MNSATQNETLYSLFCNSYTLASAYAARIADELEAKFDDAPLSVRKTDIDATVRPAKR